ncbi:MAG: 3'(2'),5'-bisphosphate nucleotidase CysQ [Parvibaculum sp.]|uniref:3'(2'),5'-bisphosphate nucleotidase CysQ n=1 Tax=Parvibaculum sp. TaxID=2024848 RepID=UPI0025CD0BCC|nr:3'(2'),5'-bisphosphate nucleotidase CysQ [Parvibaculum sp.]MCE9648658.1 3'(2'),5'-bisphosphate nucleotidase CysQ [Parvibaculum sp.]
MPAPEPTREEDRELLVAAVREAGRIALGYYQTKLKTWMKSGDSIVTEADIAVNDQLHKDLAQPRPDYGWLSEETEDDPARLTRSRVWVVDPIDGTRAFAKGKPHFAISVALVENGRPVQAALFNPATDEFFEAETGRGATLNGVPIAVGVCSAIEGSRMAAHGPMFKHPAWPEAWPEMEIIERNSVAYRIALVACNEADAALALNTKNDWDLAAADLILTEAGGRLTSHDGKPLIYNRELPRHRSLLAAGPKLYDALFARVGALTLPA